VEAYREERNLTDEELERGLRSIELAGLTETYVLVLRVLSREDGPITAFAAGCMAFPFIGRTPSIACTEWGSRRLAKLRDLGLVEQPKRGWWQITGEGRHFLEQKGLA
jgi:DNA-directed RNA polymerase subunit RPC12/RpoP